MDTCRTAERRRFLNCFYGRSLPGNGCYQVRRSHASRRLLFWRDSMESGPVESRGETEFLSGYFNRLTVQHKIFMSHVLVVKPWPMAFSSCENHGWNNWTAAPSCRCWYDVSEIWPQTGRQPGPPDAGALFPTLSRRVCLPFAFNVLSLNKN